MAAGKWRKTTKTTKKNNIQSELKKLKSTVNTINKGIETKQYGVQSLTDSLSTSFLPLNLNAMSAGDGISGREGQEIYMKGISFRFAVRQNGVPSTYQNCRIIVYVDKQPNKANPVGYSSLLQDVTTGSDLQTSHYQHDYQKRFRVLLDKGFVLNSQHPQWNYNCYKKINMKASYADGSSGIGSVTTNAVSMLLISDRGIGANSPLCYNSTRLYFTG